MKRALVSIFAFAAGMGIILSAAVSQPPEGGEQFPPLDSVELPGASAAPPERQDAMSRLSDRANNTAAVDEGPQGFEASVHKIKEQVLPRLLERVDPEAAASLNKEELTEEFRPIILEVLAELKLTLNRREQFALEKVLVDELLGFGHVSPSMPPDRRQHCARILVSSQSFR